MLNEVFPPLLKCIIMIMLLQIFQAGSKIKSQLRINKSKKFAENGSVKKAALDAKSNN